MPVSDKFAIQEIFKWALFDVTTGESRGYIQTLKEAKLNQEAETVYAMGGVGNSKLVGFSHSKTVNVTLSSAVYDSRVVASILGSPVKTAINTNLLHYDVLTMGGANTVTTTYTALGAAGAQIQYAYIVGDDGAFTTTLTQHATTPSATQFTYTVGTKLITTVGIAAGTKIAVFYKVTAAVGNRTFESLTTAFASTVRAVGFGFAVDMCTKKRYGAQIILAQAKLSDNMELALAADGEPASQDIQFEALKDCLSDKLMEVIIFEADLTV